MPDSFSTGSIDKWMVQSYCTVFCQRQYYMRIIIIVTSKRRVDPGGGRKCITTVFTYSPQMRVVPVLLDQV